MKRRTLAVVTAATLLFSGIYISSIPDQTLSIKSYSDITVVGDRDAFSPSELAMITAEEFEVSDNNLYYKAINGILFDKSGTKIKRYPVKRIDTSSKIDIPDYVTEICDYAFIGFPAENLEYLDLGKNVSALGKDAISDILLEPLEIRLPDNIEVFDSAVIEMRTNIFKRSSGQKSLELKVNKIDISSSVRSIHDIFLNNTPNLKSFEVESGNSFYSSDQGILYNADKTELIKCPQKTELKTYEIPDGTVKIDTNAFAKTKLESVTIPESVKIISRTAFDGCKPVIKGYAGSYVQQFAGEMDYEFVELEKVIEPEPSPVVEPTVIPTTEPTDAAEPSPSPDVKATLGYNYDVNNDGIVDVMDLNVLKVYLFGITDSVPMGSPTPEPSPSDQPEKIIEKAFDVDDSVKITENSDGTLRVEYTEKPCTLTFPAEWKDKFVIRDNILYDKLAFYNEESDGKVFGISFDETKHNTMFGYLGQAGDRYVYWFKPNDVRFDINNKAEMDEYLFLSNSMTEVFDSAECIPEGETTYRKVVRFLDQDGIYKYIGTTIPDMKKALGQPDYDIMAHTAQFSDVDGGYINSMIYGKKVFEFIEKDKILVDDNTKILGVYVSDGEYLSDYVHAGMSYKELTDYIFFDNDTLSESMIKPCKRATGHITVNGYYCDFSADFPLDADLDTPSTSLYLWCKDICKDEAEAQDRRKRSIEKTEELYGKNGSNIVLDSNNFGYGIVNDGPLNIRSAPNTSASIVAQLTKGKMMYIKAVQGKWLRIESSEGMGYVHSDYVYILYPVQGSSFTPKTGEINGHGDTVKGYTENFVKNNVYGTVRENLENGWHITVKNVYHSSETLWLECWDTDDGDYYGWVNVGFIDFY